MLRTTIANVATLVALTLALTIAATTAARAQDADTTRPAMEASAAADSASADSARLAQLPLRESLIPLQFVGDARFTSQLADRPGLFSEIPDDYARFELTPTLLLYDVPFSAHVLLSTEQNERRQSINSVVFGLDFRQLQASLMRRALDKVNDLRSLKQAEALAGADHVRDSLTALGEEGMRDIERLRNLASYESLREHAFSETADLLQGLGVLSSTEKFFMNFPALEVGVTYPRYTPLTLSSVPVTGANIEFNPGDFYIAFAGGSSQRVRTGEEILQRRLLTPLPEIPDTIPAPTYERTLYAGRLGYGKKDGSHFFLTTMWARDDANDPPVDSVAADTLGVRFAPKSNFIIGADAVISLENDLVRLEGEINGSVLDGDINSPGFKNDDIPKFLVDLVKPTISSSVDYAYALRTIVNIADIGTKLSGTVRMIGPGYQSFGSPTLRNDLFRYELRYEQRLLARQISLTSFLRHDRDNLIDWKPATTEVTAYGIGLGLTFKRLPYLRVNYAPYHQTNDAAGERSVDNTTTTFSAVTGYSFRTGSLTNSANLTYALQQSTTPVQASDYGVGTLQLNYTAVFAFPLTLDAGIGLSSLSAAGDSTANILSLDFGGSFTAFDIWEGSAGVTISKQTDVDSRFGFFLGSSIALWDYGYLDVRAEKNTYENSFLFADRFEEFILRTTLSTRW
jgi:hypothetical protein